MNAGSAPYMAAWLQSAWLARYLDRQLDAGEAAWFEAYLLDKPDLLAVVEIDNAMRDAMATDHAAMRPEVDVEPLLSNGREEIAPFVVDAPRNARRWLRWIGLAAALVLGVGIGSLARHSPWSARGNAGLIVNPERIVFDAIRGGSATPIAQRGAGRSRYVFVEVAVPPTASEVHLRRGTSVEALVVSSEGFVSFLFDTQDAEGKTPLFVEYDIDGRRRTQTVTVDQLTGEKS